MTGADGGAAPHEHTVHDPAAAESDLLTRREVAARVREELRTLDATPGPRAAARIAALERAIARLDAPAPVRLR